MKEILTIYERKERRERRRLLIKKGKKKEEKNHEGETKRAAFIIEQKDAHAIKGDKKQEEDSGERKWIISRHERIERVRLN